MEISIVGCIMAAAIATLCLFGRKTAIISCICAFAFPSTALFTLTSLGGSSITLPQFGLFCLFYIALLSGDIQHKISDIFEGEASAKVLALVTIFALGTAFILPRLFQDVTEVFSLARGASGKGNILSTVPLAPTSGNITQPFYFLGNVAGFFAILILCQTKRSVETVFSGLVALTAVHALGGFVDFLSKYAVGFDLFEFLRTAKYAMLTDVDVLSFKRIVGLYPEASVFAYTSVAYTGLMFGAWRILNITGARTLFFSVAVCLLISTSSTAYFCIIVLIIFYTVTLIKQISSGQIEELAVILFLSAILIAILILSILILYPRSLGPFTDLIERMVFNKADSESARGRFAWNSQAIINFIRTGGIGAGLGSLRSSSWPLTLIAEQGIIGTALYFLFLCTVFFPQKVPRQFSDPKLSGIALSCQTMLIATLVAATVSSALFDLGAPFYIAAACAIAANRVNRGKTLYLRWFGTSSPSPVVALPVVIKK